MTDTPGSSALTEEQQDFYLRRFGVRYTHVQSTPFVIDDARKVHLRASRWERRRNRRRGNK